MWPRSHKDSVVNEDPLKDAEDDSDNTDDDMMRNGEGEFQNNG